MMIAWISILLIGLSLGAENHNSNQYNCEETLKPAASRTGSWERIDVICSELDQSSEIQCAYSALERRQFRGYRNIVDLCYGASNKNPDAPVRCFEGLERNKDKLPWYGIYTGWHESHGRKLCRGAIDPMRVYDCVSSLYIGKNKSEMDPTLRDFAIRYCSNY